MVLRHRKTASPSGTARVRLVVTPRSAFRPSLAALIAAIDHAVLEMPPEERLLGEDSARQFALTSDRIRV